MVAKGLMVQWQRPVARVLPPRVQTLGLYASRVSLGVFLPKKRYSDHFTFLV